MTTPHHESTLTNDNHTHLTMASDKNTSVLHGVVYVRHVRMPTYEYDETMMVIWTLKCTTMYTAIDAQHHILWNDIVISCVWDLLHWMGNCFVYCFLLAPAFCNLWDAPQRSRQTMHGLATMVWSQPVWVCVCMCLCVCVYKCYVDVVVTPIIVATPCVLSSCLHTLNWPGCRWWW